MGGRREGREHALQLLFQWDLSRGSIHEVRTTFWTLNQETEAESQVFADHLSAGTVQHIDQIDALLARHTEHWRIPRMAVVDRNVLRLSTFELLFENQTPRVVAINEALEIARKFSTSESIQFINGILDSIRKELEPQESEQP